MSKRKNINRANQGKQLGIEQDLDQSKLTAAQFLQDSASYYFANSNKIIYSSPPNIQLKDIALYRVDEVTFDDNAPRKEALENVISSLQLDGIIFLYLVRGTRKGVEFYYGVAKDSESPQINGGWTSVYDVGKHVLEPSLRGNFRGSKISPLSPDDKIYLLKDLKHYNSISMLEGVPGIVEDNEKFQSVDRLVNTMLGDTFVVLVQAKALTRAEIEDIEKDIYDFYDMLIPSMKVSIQKSDTNTTVESIATTIGEGSNSSKQVSKNAAQSSSSASSTGTSQATQDSKTSNTSTTKQTNSSNSSGTNSTSNSGTEGTSTTKGGTTSSQSGTSETHTKSTSTSEGTTDAFTTSKNETKTKSINTNTGSSNSVEAIDRMIQSWVNYIDEVLLKRIDYGKGKGLFVTSVALFAENKPILHKLENVVKSIYSGEIGNKVPMQAVGIKAHSSKWEAYTNLQMPIGSSVVLPKKEEYARSCFSQYFLDNKATLGNWISTNELSLITGLPRKEVVGIGLREEVEFGLNYSYSGDMEKSLVLGNLVQSGDVLKEVPVALDKDNLNKHTFITGVTGSGKTTTCQKILHESHLPFMVIEPAKTEYRSLIGMYPELLVFTPGRDDMCPFRLNPFEFFPHESITSRVDMIKASIEAAFDMEAAIPQIIEAAIYRCYEKYGWDIHTNTNCRYDDPFADGVYAFPTLSDLIEATEKEVDIQGFDERLRKDYVGSIRARLQGLVVGAKGQMLNARRSIDFKDLLSRRVVIELEEIRSGSQKSLIMGFILMNLVEALKAKYNESGEFKHILLVEEAHRLLSRYTPGDSLTKKQSIETFTDILAEVRKYGESLVIVDQIPGKLTPEVLKNTNTKIVHKIFAQDDKEAIGNTMVLSDEQKEFLSNLATGRTVVFTQGWNKALQVQVAPLNVSLNDYQVTPDMLRNGVLGYYLDNYQKGVFSSLLNLSSLPTLEYFKTGLQQRLYDVFEAVHKGQLNRSEVKILQLIKTIRDVQACEAVQWDDAIRMLYESVYRNGHKYATEDGLNTYLKTLGDMDSTRLEDISDYIRDQFDYFYL